MRNGSGMPLRKRAKPRREAGGIRVAVIGGSFSGNKGASAMLESAILNLSRSMPEPIDYDVISIYPRRDRARRLPENVRIVSAPPIQLILLLPPLAALYALLGRMRLPRKFLLAFRPLGAIARAAALLDVSGISFVDGRGATLAYNVACNLPAIMVGTPFVKLSQALGPFRSFPNRTAARFILSRARMVFARGRRTEDNLKELGITNVSPAADLAFILNDGTPVPELSRPWLDALPRDATVIGVCPSQVLASYCARRGTDLVATLSDALDTLHEETGAHILVIAHSLLEPDKHSRNNDFHVCRGVYERLSHREAATLVAEDLSASELRAVIARCSCLIATRFHAMISALCVGVPTLVIAWSHKYREVMDEFGLGGCVLDAEGLDGAALAAGARRVLGEREKMRATIETGLAKVTASARAQIEYAAAMLTAIPTQIAVGATARRLYKRFYAGRFRKVYLGYASDPAIREGAASGGLVSSLLKDLFDAGKISGAVACRTEIENGRLEFRTRVCSTPREVLDCRTSIYSDFNHARSVTRMLEERDGAFAIVALPCQWKAINRFVEGRPALERKIALRIGLWCGHATDRRLIDDFLRLKNAHPGDMRRFFYRKGLWRGETVIELRDGGTRTIPFQTGYGLLQNLYVDCKKRCFSCVDHFCEGADVSFGDAWLRELKSAGVKHSMAIAFTERGLDALRELASRGGARLAETAPELAVQSQKRAVIWHTFGNAGRNRTGRLLGFSIPNRCACPPRWNDILSSVLILAAYRAYASPFRELLLKLPWPCTYPYMLAQKAFLNF
jgi:coenzyme F420-reducing hydrogenase beta subunit/polysaccharide pyruvyl transferase WcaK-like protein